jgi:tetratricopeptide (TPR) repeat protein
MKRSPYPLSLNLLKQASLFLNQSQFDKAEAIALEVIESNKEELEAYRLLAHLYKKKNDYKKGLEWVEKALSISKSYAPIYEIQGLIFLKEKKNNEAKEAFKKNLLLFPQNKKNLNSYTTLILEISNSSTFEKDVSFLEKLINKIPKESPNLPILYFNIASIYEHFSKSTDTSKKNIEVAITYYKKAINLNPEDTNLYPNLAKIYNSLEKPEFSLELFEKALSLIPSSEEFKFNLAHTYNYIGNIEKKNGFIENSIAYYKKATDFNPTNAVFYSNLANAYNSLGKTKLSLKLFEKALFLNPSSILYQFNLSRSYLLNGKFKEGFTLYRSRIHMKGFKKVKDFSISCKAPLWEGEDLTGKSLFVYPEQGIGDTIQFIRYLPWIIKKAKTVFFIAEKVILELISYNFPQLTIVKMSEIGSRSFDFQAPIMHLPIIHNTNLHNIPRFKQYLKSPSGKQTNFTNFFNTNKLKIGFSWQGNPAHQLDSYRSIHLQKCLPLITEFKDTANFYSLQKGIGEKQLELLPEKSNLISLGHLFNDFSDTAAVVEQLDLVITIDSSIAHLSGALGKPTWVLLPLANDWRWLLNRTDSPWYPSITLFRQKIKNDWTDTFKLIKKELKTFKKTSYSNPTVLQQ